MTDIHEARSDHGGAHYIQLNEGARWYFGRCHESAKELKARPLVEAAALINRFTGHTGGTPFDLVTHSLHVYEVVKALGGTTEEMHTAGGHDLHEVFVGDVSRPLKLALRDLCQDCDGRSCFDRLEDDAAGALANRFGWQWPHPAIVKTADAMVLGWEAEFVFGEGTARDWGLFPTTVPRPDKDVLRLTRIINGQHS